MDYASFESLRADELKAYINQHAEKDYLLVDVRQPQEYTQAHIPGSLLMPLMELQSKIFDLPSDKALVFYCHSGGRSMLAADLAAEAEVTEKGVYNLAGGIVAWQGKMLADHPKVQIFDKTKTLAELLMTAIDMEKGAFLFYTHIIEIYPKESFYDTILQLSKAETAHAKTIYNFLEKNETPHLPFEEMFEHLKGDILEGGEKLAHVIRRVKNFEGNLCLNLLELALHIEYTAFDLYRTMAEKAENPEAKDAFLTIAQAEKSHMRLLGKAVLNCSKL